MACPNCGGVDSWHYDLTSCVDRLVEKLRALTDLRDEAETCYADQLKAAKEGPCELCACPHWGAPVAALPIDKAGEACQHVSDGDGYCGKCGLSPGEPAPQPAANPVEPTLGGPADAFERRLVAALRKIAPYANTMAPESFLEAIADELEKKGGAT